MRDEDGACAFRTISHSELRRVLTRFGPREREILCLKWGLTGGREHTANEVAMKFGVSVDIVKELKANASGWL